MDAFAPAGDAVAVAVTGAANEPVRTWLSHAPTKQETDLELAVLHNVPDRAYRRWSFSAMAARELATPRPMSPNTPRRAPTRKSPTRR